jgi:hypothetical protein
MSTKRDGRVIAAATVIAIVAVTVSALLGLGPFSETETPPPDTTPISHEAGCAMAVAIYGPAAGCDR